MLTPRAEGMPQFISALLMAHLFRAPVPLTHREAHVACGCVSVVQHWFSWTQLYERPSLLLSGYLVGCIPTEVQAAQVGLLCRTPSRGALQETVELAIHKDPREPALPCKDSGEPERERAQLGCRARCRGALALERRKLTPKKRGKGSRIEEGRERKGRHRNRECNGKKGKGQEMSSCRVFLFAYPFYTGHN